MADNVKTLLDEAQVLATLAVSYDQQKDLEASIYFYGVSSKLLSESERFAFLNDFICYYVLIIFERKRKQSKLCTNIWNKAENFKKNFRKKLMSIKID